MKWTEGIGLALVNRDLTSMRIQAPNDNSLQYEILQLFPFTSESKRMGIIVRVGGISDQILLLGVLHESTLSLAKPLPPPQDMATGEITFYMKGADSVMSSIVQYNDWMEEEVSSHSGHYNMRLVFIEEAGLEAGLGLGLVI